MPEMPLAELVAYLDEYLKIEELPDSPGAENGLQVQNRAGTVKSVVACTDACQATIDAAAERGADLMIVHHGLFWAGLRPLTGRNYRRVRALLDHDIALYSAHIPLDAHPEVGNNIQLARAIELEVQGEFGEWEGHPIGFHGTTDVTRAELAGRVEATLGVAPFVIPCGPERVRRVGVVTGGASSLISQARDAGLDTFITGEGPHYTYFDAEEWGLNVFYAGHYATETLGVKALAKHLEERFDLDWEFVDHPTGL